MRIYLQTVPDNESNPRFYHLILQKDLLDGWSLLKESGVQGKSGKVTKQHYTDREEAESAMLSSRDRQLNRGYRVVFVEGQASP